VADGVRVADYIMDCLVRRGVDCVFVLTGNGAMYINDAIAQQRGVRYFCARNEAAAPIMAEAFARLTGKLGVVSVTSGPGATNAVAGLAEAWVDSGAVLILSGQAPNEQLPRPGLAQGIRSFGTAGIDPIPIVSSLTKYAVTVTDPATIRYHLEKACHLALSGRPGPVWIDLPMDVQYALVDHDSMQGYTAEGMVESDPSEAAKRLIELLATARRPVVVAGQGIRQSRAIGGFKKLADALRMPVLLTRLGQDLLPFSHALNMGQVGRRGAKYSKSMMAEADLVLALGSSLAVQAVGHQLEHFPSDARIVAVDIDPAQLAHHGERVTLPVLCDAGRFIEAVLERRGQIGSGQWAEWLAACQRRKNANPMVVTAQRRDPIDLYYFMSRLDAIAGEKHVFITDAGSNYYIGGQVYHFENGQRELTSSAYAAMGLTIPLAIGAAVAAPDHQVLAVTGDGSLELNIQELKTLSYYGFDVKLFVINNGGYVSMRNWQDQFFDGRRIGSDGATGAEMLNLHRVAQAFDMPYAMIGSVEEIDGKLRDIVATRGPLMVEVMCDPQQVIVQPFLDTGLSS